MIFFLWLLTLASALPATVDIKLKRDLAFDYDKDLIKGVNLGGWFLLEPYITPSLFDAFSDNIPVDEYHYCEQLGKDECKKRLEKHWASWYTEDDFKEMADKGLNMVRIPLGYWAFKMYDYDPYVSGQQEYLDEALKWCKKHGLKVWIDLHGAAGSQNGFDNSGLRDHLEFQSNKYNTAITLDVLKIIAKKYGGSDYDDVIIGIELLNEPLGPSLDMNKLKDFFNEGYSRIRDTGSSQAVIFHDAFQPAGYWNDFLNTNDRNWNVVVDHHHYQVFSGGELQMSIQDHIDTACNWGWDAKKENKWNVCGEWSAALTDCARWLNGVGRGARWSGDYDGVNYIDSCDAFIGVLDWPDWHKVNVIKYIEAQLDAFEQTGGWIFWNWKTEYAIDWDMKKLIDNDIFPQPFDHRRYPNQCNF